MRERLTSWIRRLGLAALVLPAVVGAQAAGTVRHLSNSDPTCGGQSPCYGTIQAAVSAAQAGDTVRILAGTYAEQVSITGKNNAPSATEADRIVIEADPGAAPGSVVLTGTVGGCTNGQAVKVQQSKFVTLRGLTITGAGGPAIWLGGGNTQNQAISLERLRLVGNGSGSCNGGIQVSRGNPDTLILNSLIYGNGRNGIEFLDATGGPHWVIENTIHGHAWNGIRVARGHVVHLVNNLITGNGTASGSTGGRVGVSRESSTSPDPPGIQLLDNLICGNRLGELDGPILDGGDAGNRTPTGTEGIGVTASPGCELPAAVYANLPGPDGQPNTRDDSFRLAANSPAIDQGLDPRTLGLPASVTPSLVADYLGPASRPRAGIQGGPARFDVGAVERLGRDTTAPTVRFTQPAANAFVRHTVTIEAQASDAGWVARLVVGAGAITFPVTLRPAPPAPAVTATASWNTATVPDGPRTLDALATDQAGHSATATRVVIVDNTPPDTRITGGPSGTSSETAATFTFTGTDNLTAPVNLQFAWRLDGGAWSAFTVRTSATVGPLAEGPHAFEVKARDQAGNEDRTPVSRSFTVSLAPTITALTPASGPIGTLVAIGGQHFAPTPDGNTVRFAGVPAVVRTASPTALTVTAPPAAVTGPVSVTTVRGTAVSPEPFTVTMTQDFALRAAPETSQVLPGAETTYTVELQSTGPAPFTGLATLTVEGVPPGATASPSPGTLTGGQRATLTVTAGATAPPGSATLTIRATAPDPSGPVTRVATVQVTVEPGGRTGLVGRLLVVDGTPIAGAHLGLAGQTRTTDAAGQFLFVDAPEGTSTLSIDANAAVPGFPIYAVDVMLTAGQITMLPLLQITPPPPPERFTPIDNATADQVVTEPRYPGLSITLPAGVTITGWDGQLKTRIALERLSPERLPVPLPHFTPRSLYQVFFGTPMGGLPSAPLPITLPNDGGLEPGQQTEIWYYDAAPFPGVPAGWRRAGTATVSEDGTRVVSDPGVGLERFCGVCGIACFPPDQPPRNPDAPHDGEPVDLVLGQQIVEQTDLAIPGRVLLGVHRTYNPIEPFGGIAGFELGLGPGWALSVDAVLLELFTGSGVPVPIRRLILPGNARFDFVRQPDGTFAAPAHPRFAGALLAADASGAHRLRFKDGTVWRFATGWQPRGSGNLTGLSLLVEQTDRNGHRLTIERDATGRPVRLVDPAGRAVEFTVDPATGRIAEARDPLGRSVTYGYDGGRLATVTDLAAGVTRHTYDAQGRILSVTDPRGVTYVTNEYDAQGRVVRQTQADGTRWTFQYTGPVGGHTGVAVVNPRGHAVRRQIGNAGFLTETVDPLGQVTRTARDARGQVTAITDPLGRVTRFTYDAQGNVTSRADPAGGARSYTYEPTFNKVTSVTDELGQVTRFEYDAQGNQTAVVLPTGARATAAYAADGDLLSVTDPLGHTTRFEYDGAGNLTAVVDPLGNRIAWAYDAASRLLAQTDARGRTTGYAYDTAGRVTAVTDPLGGVTRFTYDANGNLLTVTDPRGGAVGYAYDAMERVAARTDPVGATESFTYDGAGNLTRHADRKGQVTAFAYDALNRRTGASYADGTTTSVAYDAVGRLVEATDSAGGTVLNQYDGLDRLIAQTTVLGTVSYGYDALGRRTRMDTPGQPPVTYGYDAASRLTQILQGSQTVEVEYDRAGRRTRLTLPNGVSAESQYDAASRATALLYRNAQGLLGDLAYQYDAAGNRARVSGSFARTGLPDAVDTASYDPANRQRALGDRAMTFDANGNLTGITDASGVTVFAWDARDRLTAVTGPGTAASFTYDAVGRRLRKVIDGTPTDFLYDGVNPVQEVADGAVASLLTGLGIDEYFARTDATGTHALLPDALGSTVALTDATGTLQTEYTYEPFGATTFTGAPSTNPFQYTGRENDGTGLYYYRARYYHPRLARFISEDPLGIASGDPNFYAYVLNSPINLRDPTGLVVMVCDRKIRGGLARIGGQHQYLFQPPNITCGSLDQPPPENPAGDICLPVRGSEGKEPQIMGCCRREVEESRFSRNFPYLPPQPYVPFANDCFNVTSRCLAAAGLENPSPGGRFCRPGKCSPPPSLPPLGP